MTWQDLTTAPAGTHHLREGAPVYAERFDEVLKFHAPGLAPVQRGGAAWHIFPDGRAAYPRRFRRTFGFYEGLAAVIDAEREPGWHHVLPSGDDAYPQRYTFCGNFQGGLCTVREENGAYLHIRPSGEPLSRERWRYAGDFRDGMAVVQADSGLSSHIAEDGRLVHGRWFLDLDVFHKGFARARDEAGWMHVDRAGQPVYKRWFAAVEPFYNGQARVERFDGGLEVIDESGAAVLELRPALRSELAALSGDLVGFWRTRTLTTAVELGVIEALPGSAEEVAERCGLRPDRTRRLLRALAELAVVEADGASFRCTPRGEHLRAEHPLTLADAAREYGHAFSQLWAALPEALRQDGGWRAPDLFAEVARDGARCRAHHRMLRSYARNDYAEVPAALGLRGDERIIDAGGGLGVLAAALVERHPQLHVILLDRPEVVVQGSELLPAHDRITWRGGDLFAPWDVQGDAVLMARVLHDWDDADALRILHQARAAVPRGGRLFAVEMVVPEGGVSGSLCDLHLLMATGGQERTAAEYSGLFAQAGFVLSEVRRLPALPSVLVGVAQ